MSKSKPNGDAESAREKAARMRAADQAAQKRRERTLRIAGGAGVVLVAVGIIGGAAIVSRSDSSTVAAPTVVEPDDNAPLPKGVLPAGDAYEFGVPVNANVNADVPTLQLWEDFQCPACKRVEELNGEGIKELGKSGKVNLILQPTTFLDVNLRTDSSARAVAAWGCAIDQDKTLEYHAAVFDAQPEREGQGWTNDELIGIAESVGVSDMDEFRSCVSEGRYRGWAANSTALFYDAEGVNGTPTGVINGVTIVTGQVLADPVELERALQATTQ